MAISSTTREIEFTQAFYTSLFNVKDGENIRHCIQCGSCSGVCPFGYMMKFPPGKMIAAIRANIFKKVLESDTLWMCVSCYACAEICPQNIPLTPALMTRAKEEIILAGNLPDELQEALTNSQRYGNPMGESPRKRGDWAKDFKIVIPSMREIKRPVDVLWFVGDYGSYHPRVQLATKALANILQFLGVDFAILGPDESSDGDSQRLAGERGLFEMLAEKNAKVFRNFKFNKIITADPHSYNALKNFYPSLGISYPVQHYTEFLVDYLDVIKPHLKWNGDMRVTYHDACYLGRANRIFSPPRELLSAIPGVELVEMAHNHTNSLCCGGGGGGMWLDGFQWEKSHTRLSEWRVREALAVNAKVLAVACTYEQPRFEDAAKMVQGASGLIVKDIAEMIVSAMEV